MDDVHDHEAGVAGAPFTPPFPAAPLRDFLYRNDHLL